MEAAEYAEDVRIPEDPVKPEWRLAQAMLALHGKRVFNGDGYGWSVCVEDRQAWPCATVEALEKLGYAHD